MVGQELTPRKSRAGASGAAGGSVGGEMLVEEMMGLRRDIRRGLNALVEVGRQVSSYRPCPLPARRMLTAATDGGPLGRGP